MMNILEGTWWSQTVEPDGVGISEIFHVLYWMDVKSSRTLEVFLVVTVLRVGRDA